jgi:hypothetical protein
MGINKKMPPQEIGLYRMAKAKKAMEESKDMMEDAMEMAMAMKLAKTIKPMSFMKKK